MKGVSRMQTIPFTITERNEKVTKIFVTELPADTDWDKFKKVIIGDVSSYKNILTGSNQEDSWAIVEFHSAQDANKAVLFLDNYQFHRDSIIKATLQMDRGGHRGNNNTANNNNNNGRRNINNNMNNNGGGTRPGPLPQVNNIIPIQHDFARPNSTDIPLRMVVDARYVGAIIGQGGANIRDITRESKARCVVDVQRGFRDGPVSGGAAGGGTLEKVINIYGMPENCSKACIKILNVVHKEAAKEGVETNGISELNAFNMERTITIRGKIEDIAIAEDKISNKLRACWENDMQNMKGISLGPHGLIAADGLAGGGAIFPNVPQPIQPFPNPPIITPIRQQRGPLLPSEVVHLWVPNSIVGALIGTKGVHIRNVMRLTGAHIRIEGAAKATNGNNNNINNTTSDSSPAANNEDDSNTNEEDSNKVASNNTPANNENNHLQQQDERKPPEERLVTIMGNDAQQYKAQFWIYQRVCEQGFQFFEEVQLTTEVAVPTKLVGRIIGKGGQNVRELQRMTGAQVKIPEDPSSDEGEETVVKIFGNFTASQAVQGRIRQLSQYQGGVVGGGNSQQVVLRAD